MTRIQITTVKGIVEQIQALINERLPNWYLQENDLGNISSYWDDCELEGTIMYDIEAIRFDYNRFNHLYHFASEEHMIAYVLVHEIGHALHDVVREKQGLWERSTRRSLHLRAKIPEFSYDMSDDEFINFRRLYTALPTEKCADRIARLLTGIRPKI